MEWLSNFGMREWLISCGVLLVVIVLIDGFRRMRQERRGEIKMERRMGGGFPETPQHDDIDGDTTAELPNGGARIVERREPSLSGNIEIETAGAAEQQRSAQHTNARRQMQARESRFQEVLAEISEREHADSNAQDIAPPANQQLLIMHAKSRANDGFNGSDLLQVLLACDMRYGDRDILHRHERAGGKGSLQFSVANMLEPGTFNLEDINSFRTPGVTFFMTMPGAEEPAKAFDCMLETAHCVAKNLDAELLDDGHHALTDATIGSYRKRVTDFTAASATLEPA